MLRVVCVICVMPEVSELVKQLRLQANASVTTRGELEHLAASFVGEMYPIGTFSSWGFLLEEKAPELDACGALLYVDRYAGGTSDRNERAEPSHTATRQTTANDERD